jgi:GNAT superfamily N-acetyltransferase
MSVVELTDPDDRACACGELLRSLPEWFGIESSIDEYERDVRGLPTLAVRDESGTAGFLAWKQHSEFSAEIVVMAIRRDLHRRGLGRALVRAAEERLAAHGLEYLQVKTLGPSRPSRGYEATRRFYEACGFRPLEELPAFWPSDNPCLILVKRL